MEKYKVTEIEWCVEDDDLLEDGVTVEEIKSTLPTKTTVVAEDESEIADILSDKYGFLVESYLVEKC